MEHLANPVGSDIVGSVRTYPVKIRGVRVTKTHRRASRANGYFNGSVGVIDCYPSKNMIWEVYQQTKITGAEQTAEKALSKADRYAADIADVRRQVDRLTLACQAMWELIRDRTGLTEEDIEAKILEIDARDGSVDGKISTKSVNCTSCGRPTNSRRGSCVMCGAPIKREHQFEV